MLIEWLQIPHWSSSSLARICSGGRLSLFVVVYLFVVNDMELPTNRGAFKSIVTLTDKIRWTTGSISGQFRWIFIDPEHPLSQLGIVALSIRILSHSMIVPAAAWLSKTYRAVNAVPLMHTGRRIYIYQTELQITSEMTINKSVFCDRRRRPVVIGNKARLSRVRWRMRKNLVNGFCS